MLANNVKYGVISRAETAKLAAFEATVYDKILASDGSDATIDIMVEKDPLYHPGVLTPLETSIIRGKIRPQTLPTTPEVSPANEPRRTTDIFGAPRNLSVYIERMGGRTLTYEGRTYTIQHVVPHKVACVTFFVELHCDINDGGYQPYGSGG
jgi:hypothetical protein